MLKDMFDIDTFKWLLPTLIYMSKINIYVYDYEYNVICLTLIYMLMTMNM